MSFAGVVAGAQTVLQLEQSAVDRAADISWLSQYESRADAVFPPVCALDHRRTYLTSVESAQDGAGGVSSFPAMDAGEVLVHLIASDGHLITTDCHLIASDCQLITTDCHLIASDGRS
jgi:hypothetical protein